MEEEKKPLLTPEERERILKEKNKWDSIEYIQYEMVKAMHHREHAILPAKNEENKKKHIRYMLSFSVKFLKEHWEMFNYHKHLCNQYVSVATLKDVPIFSYKLDKRKHEEEYQNFDKNYADFVESYSGFFDFDGKENFEKCYQEAKEFHSILTRLKIPFYCLNSSLYGFHFIIPSEYMPEMNIRQLLPILNNVIHWVKDTHKFECLDETVTDMKRLRKLPYSYEAFTQCVCLPLKDEQFLNYNFDMVNVKNVLDVRKTGYLKKRGLLIREHGLTFDELKSNVLKFIELYK